VESGGGTTGSVKKVLGKTYVKLGYEQEKQSAKFVSNYRTPVKHTLENFETAANQAKHDHARKSQLESRNEY
jgi:hypothetical protein